VWDGDRLVAAAPLYVKDHSLGEFVAASAAGAMTPEDCVRLVAERGLIRSHEGFRTRQTR